ncbi:unnamed protein product, partial [Iphiclides podalirius]
MFFDVDEEELAPQDLLHVVSRELFALSSNFDRNYRIRSVPTHTEDGIPIRKIYVSNLPPKTTRTELFGMFAHYGFIKSCWLRMGDRGPNKSPMPTYAFITFSNPADAHKALQAPFHEKQLRGRSLRISPADSWHQPAEDADGQVQWRPNDQLYKNLTAAPTSYEGRRQNGISLSGMSSQAVIETKAQGVCSVNGILQPVEQHSDCYETYTILDILNMDCMHHILSYITLRDLILSERVSKRWQITVQEYILSIRVYKTSWWQHVPITMTTAVLRRLLQRVGNSLVRLHIDHNWSALNDRTAHTIGKYCPNLEELKVVGMHTKNWNPLIYGCKNLKNVGFISCNKLNDSSLIHLVKNETPVEQLLVANNTHVTGLFLTGLNNRKLTSLSFYNCYSLQGAVLSAAIDTLPTITTLRLDVCPVSIWKIIPLIMKKLPKLVELSLSEYTSLSICLTRFEVEDFCNSLSVMKNLRVINFSRNVYISNVVLKQIARTCSKLQSLNISCCNAAKDVVPAGFPGHRYAKGVSDEGLAAVFRSCPGIAYLDVSYLAGLTDEGLAQAARLGSLEVLTARGTPTLSSQPFALCLASCHRLREIDVCGCDGVSEEIVVAARRAVEAHPRKLLLMVANTPASEPQDLPEHKLLTVNTETDLCNPHLRPDFIDQIFEDSSDDSLDDLYDDDLDFLDADDDDDDFFDEEMENIEGIFRLGLQPDDVLLL